MRRLTLALTFIHSAFIAGCVTAGSPSVADSPLSVDQTQINDLIVQAFQEGRYVDAIKLERQSNVSQSERDLALGQTILQGLADPQAAQRPMESVEEGIGLLEKSALQGRRPAISGLAALFFNGLPGDGKNTSLVQPSTQLNACWERAKANPSIAATCVSLRHAIRVDNKRLK